MSTKFRTSIIARIKSINLLIVIAVAAIVLVTFIQSNSIRLHIGKTLNRDIQTMLSSAQLGRALNAIFAEANLVLMTFPERDDYLNSQKKHLLRTLQDQQRDLYKDNVKSKYLEPLELFIAVLRPILYQCSTINSIFSKIRQTEQLIEQNLSAINELLIREIRRDSSAAAITKKIQAVLPKYKESLFRVSLLIDTLKEISILEQGESYILQEEITVVLNEFNKNLQEIDKAGTLFIPYKQRLTVLTNQYQRNIKKLGHALYLFQVMLRNFQAARKKLNREMESFDTDMANTAARMQKEIKNTIASSLLIIIFLSATIMATLIFLTRQIRKMIAPVGRLAEKAEDMARGHYSTKTDDFATDTVSAGNSNEITALAKSFNDMAVNVRDREKDLETSRRMLQLVMDNIPVFIFWKGRDLVYLGCNNNFAIAAGIDTPENIVGKTDAELTWNTEIASFFKEFDQRVLETGKPELHIVKQHQSRGKQTWLDMNKIPLCDQADDIFGVLGIYEDITERIEAERELKNAKNYITNIIESMPSVMIGVDREINVTQWNNQAMKATGVPAEKAVGQPLDTIFPDISGKRKRIIDAIFTRRIQSDMRRARRKKDATIYEDITIYPLIANGVEGAVIRIDDVTDKVNLEQMMVQSEKMMSVGGLAAGMAHEINNPLAGMIQTAEVLSARLSSRLDIPVSRKAAEAAGTTLEAVDKFMTARNIPQMLETINTSGKRISEIINNMLSFARKSDSDTSMNSVNDLLDQTLELAATDYNLKKQHDFRKITIEKKYTMNLPDIPCKKAEIQQVLLNLLRNGAEAMQEAGTKNPRFILSTCFDNTRQMVCITIEDNGPGIPREIQKRIFEPFFTTKPVGIGTGLGLSVSYFIITEKHKGEMSFEAHPGIGSNFTIHLPIKIK